MTLLSRSVSVSRGRPVPLPIGPGLTILHMLRSSAALQPLGVSPKRQGCAAGHKCGKVGILHLNISTKPRLASWDSLGNSPQFFFFIISVMDKLYMFLWYVFFKIIALLCKLFSKAPDGLLRESLYTALRRHLVV